MVGDLNAKLTKKPLLDLQPPLVGIQHQRLILLQIGRDVAFGIGQRLLADIVRRYFAAMCIGDLDIIAKDLVIAHLEASDVQPVALSTLQVGNPVFGITASVHQLIQLATKAGADNARSRQRSGWFVCNRRHQRLQDRLTQRQCGQRGGRRALAGDMPIPAHRRSFAADNAADRRYLPQHGANAHQVTRQRNRLGHAVCPPLQVTDLAQRFAQFQTGRRIADEILNQIKPPLDSRNVEQRLVEPTAQQPPAHRCQCPIQHAQQTPTRVVAAQRLGQFQVAPRRFVQRHKLAHCIGGEMRQLLECAGLHGLQIAQNRRRSAHRLLPLVQPIAVERGDMKMAQKPRIGSIGCGLPRLHRGKYGVEHVDQTV